MSGQSREHPPSASVMRDLRRLHAGAVTAVTYADDRGLRGVTVTAFVVVSLDPPRVAVCLDRSTEALTWVSQSKGFAVSVLGDRQAFLAERFAGRAPLVNRRFDGVRHRITVRGNPVLDECLVWFDCTVDAVVAGGDHDVVLGSVQEAGSGTATAPLLYFDGRYASVGLV
jgi:flavin-dependent trigonelline monooxygenase, reductase component